MEYYNEHDAMEVGYNIATGIATPYELIEQTLDVIVFPFDPTNITSDDIFDLEKYFASIDDFEKAIILRDLKK